MTGRVVDRDGIDALIGALAQAGYEVIGPTVRDDVIVYAPIGGTDDLPAGWTDHQDGGSYGLTRRDDDALFGYTVGPQSWKKYLFPPRSTLLNISKVDGEIAFAAPPLPDTRYAFIGVRACELAAIAIQDKVFLESGYVDRTYHNARRSLFTVAVNCAVAGGTCFCVSMGAGPECTTGFDLVITEVIGEGRHDFVIEPGSVAGGEFLDELGGRQAADGDRAAVAAVVANTTEQMGRELDTAGLKELLYDNRESPRWDQVAARCLTCTNCTMVCPTCFCATTEDTASLDGSTAARHRRWDSCFTLDFSALHRRPVRESPRARYRQWMTHKLASWQDQFGEIGCVGCGRCITWCPVGIDITEEAAAIRAGMEVPA